MPIRRPHPPRIETFGDWSAYVANFFRAISADPAAVAYHASQPVDEATLHATHRWLMGVAEPEPVIPAEWDRLPILRRAYLAGYARQDGSYGRAFRRRMRTDPDYYDAKVAGRWVWGACCWIGSGWCDEDPAEVEALVAGEETQVSEPSDRAHGRGVHARATGNQMPALSPGGTAVNAVGYGINGLIPPGFKAGRPQLADAYDLGRDVHRDLPAGQAPELRGDSGAAGMGVHASAGSTLMPSDQRPLLTGGFQYGGRGVHADVIPPPEKRVQLHTGNSEHGRGVHGQAKPSALSNKRMVLDDGRGVHPAVRKAGRPQLADAYDLGRGVHSHGALGTCAARLEWLTAWFRVLADRFRTARFCCGDWTETIAAWRRVCGSPSTTTRLGTVGLFLDPPYRIRSKCGKKSRAEGLYGRADRGEILDRLNDDVLAYCLEHGGDPQFRIVVCGYEDNGYEVLEQHGWEVIAWRARGGYGNRTEKGRENRGRERMWCSPHCERPDAGRAVQQELFGGDEDWSADDAPPAVLPGDLPGQSYLFG